ncbi:hypothetical protein Pmani_035883 [Petrolisthes manimaculis]|uniref:NADH dehydrogenase [ubiquinone] 1 beta subcomplex subunit 3 n=1 Tax=Petrolisthes manimaculis TaxID=1843537 RepID=A0AAE1NKQ9_9EUCA|nr:hypothetical protein Pmani_035883 [Petrolisthes manimaculis]
MQTSQSVQGKGGQGRTDKDRQGKGGQGRTDKDRQGKGGQGRTDKDRQAGKMGVDKAWKVPDYRIYKVEEIPELLQVQRALASHGLKDPWLRNEAWRYHPGFGSHWGVFRQTMFRGLKWGLVLAVGTVALERTFGGHGHGHSDDGHH